MILCPRCSKENQDHYKFCLGCGGQLAGQGAAPPADARPPTPPSGYQHGQGAQPGPASFGGASVAAAGPGVAAVSSAASAAPVSAPALLPCPNCGANVPVTFKFCGTCGHVMGGAPAAPKPTSAARASLVLIRSDGTEGETLAIPGTLTIGRNTSELFSADAYLSPRHATFTVGSGGVQVRDENSLNGVYLRIDRDTPTELPDGSVFRVGQEIIRIDYLRSPKPGPDGVEIMGSPGHELVARISLIMGRKSYGNSFCIPVEGVHLGRERGDIIFPDDGYVSGLHCRVHQDGGRMYITDIGSSNGTFIRLSQERLVARGALLLMGQQLFRVEY